MQAPDCVPSLLLFINGSYVFVNSDNHYHFQVCIVDEATQCVEVETLIPLILGVKTLVLVGDPNQLPATIMSKVWSKVCQLELLELDFLLFEII